MHISLFDDYSAKNSLPVWEAFCQGLDRLGINYSFHNHDADIAVIWSVLWAGRMKPNQQVWNQFRNSNRPVIVLEVGTLKRNITWRIGLNGTWSGCYNFENIDSLRPSKLELSLSPWNRNGRDIVIALQRYDSQQWFQQLPMHEWLENTIEQIRKYTDRPVTVRQHPRQKTKIPPGYNLQVPLKINNSYDSYDFDQCLKQAWAVVNYNSGPGIRSVMQGIPAFVGQSSLAYPVANHNLRYIENPSCCNNREGWLEKISHTEWTIEEISSGFPVKRLLDLL